MNNINIEPVWVVHLCNALYPTGGVQSFLMNYYRNIDRSKIQFAFVVQRNVKFEFDDEIRKLGGRVYYLPEMEKDIYGYLNGLDKILKSNKQYKIAHAHMNHRNGLALAICKKNKVVKRISHSHGCKTTHNLITNIRVNLFKCLGRYVSTDFWACSQEAGIYLFGKRKFNRRGIILENSIDVKKFLFNEEVRKKIRFDYCIDEDDFILGFVGDYSNNKNLKFAIKIFSEFYDKNNKSKLLVVGGGNNIQYNDIKKYIELLNLEGKVILLGARNDVNQIMNGMDALIFPSINEGLGMVAIEAQASGLNVYASAGVPAFVKITNLVTYINLNEGAVNYSRLIKNKKSINRHRFNSIVENSRFNILNNVKILEKYYLEK